MFYVFVGICVGLIIIGDLFFLFYVFWVSFYVGIYWFVIIFVMKWFLGFWMYVVLCVGLFFSWYRG